MRGEKIMMPQPVKMRFSVDEYYKMIDLGLLKDYERAEIIDGELINKMPIGEKHASLVNLLMKIFVKNASDELLVSVQNPIRLSGFYEPEPDIVIADLTKYDGKRHPTSKEIILLIEVSDTTLDYDRKTKLPIYAEAEIPEVWIINLNNDSIQVHKNPLEGSFSKVEIFRRGDILTVEALSNLQIEVDKVFA